MVSKTVSTAISALVLVMPVLLTTSLIMSSLIKRTPSAKGQHHDKIRLIAMSSAPPEGPGTPLDSDRFRRACGRFATGITVVTTLDADGPPHSMTANPFTSAPLA